MKRGVLFFLVLTLLFSAVGSVLPAARAENPGDAEEKTSDLLYAYEKCETIPSLFSAAEAALKDGNDPGLVYDTMLSVAEEKNFLREAEYALENTAAYGTALYEKASAVIGGEDRAFDPETEVPLKNRWETVGFDPYGRYSGSEAFNDMIADPGARYSLGVGLWTESDFTRVFGTAVSKFRAARPRPGYVCIVISDKAQSAVETAWNTGSDASSFLGRLRSVIKATVRQFEDSGMNPIFTGNPDVASTLWVYDLHYPFQGWWGHNNQKEVRGFSCETSLTVIDTATGKSAAKVSAKNRLPNVIYSWHDWIAEADQPDLTEDRGFKSFPGKVEAAIVKQYAAEDLSPRLTPVTAARAMSRVLLEQVDEKASPWVRAICESGAQNVRLETDAVSFVVRGFDPNVKELGTYAKAEDSSVWLKTALENASKYNLELTLPVDDGRLTQKAEKSLAASLKKAANAAEAAFKGKDMVSALMGRFFPAPTNEKNPDASALLTPSEAFSRWYTSQGIDETGVSMEDVSLICYAQKNLTINAKPGPHALEILLTGADPGTMLADCAKEALDTLAFSPASSRSGTDSIEDTLNTALANASLAAHKKTNNKYAFSIDLEELTAGKNPDGYLELLRSFNRAETLAGLLSDAAKLPDTEALPFPGSKKLSGPKGGTKVTFAPASGSDPIYVRVLSAKDNTAVASAFVLPGKKVSVQVPAGEYKIAFCSGPYWYGEEELFSTLGKYYISESTQILEPKYNHTFKLDPADEYELLFSEATLADFK